MKTIDLNSGEKLHINIVEITSIPLIDNIVGNSIDAILDSYKNEMNALLSEIYNSVNVSNIAGQKIESSIELIWHTEKVNNQTYNARIHFYIVIRTISLTQETNTLESLTKSIKTRLQMLQYQVQEIEYDSFLDLIHTEGINQTTTLVKNESIENLGNQYLPACYSFERIDARTTDFASLVTTISQFPDIYLSISLVSTSLKLEEQLAIQQLSQALDSLKNGISAGGMGTISITSAEKYADIYQYYLNNKNEALFEFTISVSGEQNAVNSVTASLMSSLIRRDGSTVSLKAKSFSNREIDIQKQFHALPWILLNATPARTNNAFVALQRLPHIVTSEEASVIFRLPIGSRTVAAGLTINDSEQLNKTYSSGLINTGDIEIGKLKSSGGKDAIGISIKDLAKHMLIVGTPGSGKTTFSVGLLDRLWKENNIPFLVIEPAKNEYRALIQSIPELQVFTPGKNTISPFIFNPFVPPKNVRLESYKSTLKTAFAAGVSMTSPLDKIFEETINNCYADHRWLDTYTVDDKGEIFNISDFVKCFQDTFNEIGYTGDAKNIGRAGTVRLKSLINLFDNYYSIPIQDILERPTVIELAAIENAEQKSLIIALLLLSILSYVNSNYVSDGGMRNFILLEEAHVLLGNRGSNGSDSNPSEIAQELVKRMLAEIRSYGVGIGIADQSPRKVTTDVVALTDMKVVFRLVEATDKQIISDSMNMNDNQVHRLARLKPGEAFFFFNRLDEPEEIITPDYRMNNNISISLSDDGIKGQVQYWKEKEKLLRPYPECALISKCKDNCDYENRLLGREIARRIFSKNFNNSDNTLQPVVSTLGKISSLVKDELNDEEVNARLMGCVKCHLWRKIMLETNIPVKHIQIENSLKKV